MSMKDWNNQLTICEVLRQINDRLQEDKFTNIRDMLALAEQMAKRMAAKLRDYNEKDDPGKWMNIKMKENFDRGMQTYLTGDAEKAKRLLGEIK